MNFKLELVIIRLRDLYTFCTLATKLFFKNQTMVISTIFCIYFHFRMSQSSKILHQKRYRKIQQYNLNLH